MSEVAEKNNEQSGVVLKGNRTICLGLKSGMTQIYTKDGVVTPVTVIDLVPNTVTQVKTGKKDGYSAVQVGILPKKVQRASLAEKGHYKASGNPGYRKVAEIRVDNAEGVNPGSVLSLDVFQEGDLIDVTAVSKGKGFQGVMKRYNFAGGAASHGASVCHRAPGSIGNRADPGRVFPGKKMAGHMGAQQVTVQNLEVVALDKENGLLLVKGSVPGPKQGILTLKKAVKAVG